MEGKEKTRIPWYLSVWFIILVSILTFWVFWIPGIVLGMIRLIKYKEKRGSSAAVILILGVPCVVMIFTFIYSIRSEAKKERQLNAFIEDGCYAEAQEFIEQTYTTGTLAYVEKSARLYELQGMYDEAVNLWVEYCNNKYQPVKIPDHRIEQLKDFIDKYQNELQAETVGKVRELISNREMAKAEEKKAKEAQEAQKKIEKEEKEAKEKAKKETEVAKVEEEIKDTPEKEDPTPTTEKEDKEEAKVEATTPKATPSPTPIPEPTMSPEDAMIDREINSTKYIHPADEYKNDNASFTIGMIYASGYPDFDYDVICVDMFITNTTDQNISFGQYNTCLVIDDFQYDSTYEFAITNENTNDLVKRVDLRPGNTCSYTFFTALPEEAETADKVIFQIGDLEALFKVGGKWLYTPDGTGLLEDPEPEEEWVRDPDDPFYGTELEGLKPIEYTDARTCFIPETEDNTIPIMYFINEDGTIWQKESVNGRYQQSDLSGKLEKDPASPYTAYTFGDNRLIFFDKNCLLIEGEGELQSGFYNGVE